MCSFWFSEAPCRILVTCLGNVTGPFGLFSRRISAIGLPVKEIKLSAEQTEQKTSGLGHRGVSDSSTKTHLE